MFRPIWLSSRVKILVAQKELCSFGSSHSNTGSTGTMAHHREIQQFIRNKTNVHSSSRTTKILTLDDGHIGRKTFNDLFKKYEVLMLSFKTVLHLRLCVTFASTEVGFQQFRSSAITPDI
jgi:hypothetical protein